MAKNENQKAGAAGVQVFELTMDNPEDQDDLNRHLHKPGEPNNSPSIPPVSSPCAPCTNQSVASERAG